MRPTRFWRRERTARRPKDSSKISSETSSPTSKSASILRASSSEICSLESSTASLATISRLRQISRSPFSGLMIKSKFSSEPNFLIIIFLNTSSRMAIMVSLSKFLKSLNSRNESIRFSCIVSYLKEIITFVHSISLD